MSMPTPREFTMNFNFKIVYTSIVYNVEISSHASLNNLFDQACAKFENHIDYDRFYIDYVIAGQEKQELASGIGLLYLDDPLWTHFKKWKEVSFYVRPVLRATDVFVRMDSYTEERPETVEESQNQERDASGGYLPPPPGLTRVDNEIYVV